MTVPITRLLRVDVVSRGELQLANALVSWRAAKDRHARQRERSAHELPPDACPRAGSGSLRVARDFATRLLRNCAAIASNCDNESWGAETFSGGSRPARARSGCGSHDLRRPGKGAA